MWLFKRKGSSTKQDREVSKLNVMYDGTMEKRKEEIIARDILSSIGLVSSKGICIEAKKYLASQPTRIELCVYAANLCIPPENNNELYLVAHAFEWAGAKYRKEAIHYLEKYIKQGAVSDYISDASCLQNGKKINQRLHFIAMDHWGLASLYSKEYMFEEAIKELYLALEIAPYIEGVYASMAQNYVKMGNYDNALKILEAGKKKKYYKTDSNYKTIIDNATINTIQKRDSGYVYKPRKRK